jgi:hypothetical protein
MDQNLKDSIKEFTCSSSPDPKTQLNIGLFSLSARRQTASQIAPLTGDQAVVMMRGDSMGDTLRRGDFALIDTTQTEIAGGGVFAILEENRSLIIYQVEASGPGRIRCTPRDRQNISASGGESGIPPLGRHHRLFRLAIRPGSGSGLA